MCFFATESGFMRYIQSFFQSISVRLSVQLSIYRYYNIVGACSVTYFTTYEYMCNLDLWRYIVGTGILCLPFLRYTLTMRAQRVQIMPHPMTTLEFLPTCTVLAPVCNNDIEYNLWYKIVIFCIAIGPKWRRRNKAFPLVRKAKMQLLSIK